MTDLDTSGCKLYKVWQCDRCEASIAITQDADPWNSWEAAGRDIECCPSPRISRAYDDIPVFTVLLPNEEIEPKPRNRVELVLEDMECGKR